VSVVGVSRIILLLLSGVVDYGDSPGVLRGCPGAVALNHDVVDTSDESEEAALTPASAPRVPNNPVLGSVLNSKAYNGYIVIDVSLVGGVDEDSSSVVQQSIRNCNTACDGTTLVDLLHHVLFSGHATELVNSIDVVSVWDEARGMRMAVLANGDWCALDAVVKSSSLVISTSLVSNFVVVHKLVSRDGFTTVAPSVVS